MGALLLPGTEIVESLLRAEIVEASESAEVVVEIFQLVVVNGSRAEIVETLVRERTLAARVGE